MRKVVAIFFVGFSLVACNEKKSDKVVEETTQVGKDPKVFDAKLAKKLGADDYGMKHYVMAFLKSGPNDIKDSAQAVQLQRAHMNNINRLAKAGKLVVAGPFMDDTPLRGIYLFNVETLEEAKELTESDPAVRAGSLVMELHPWYGSAALMQVVETHKKVAKIEI